MLPTATSTFGGTNESGIGRRSPYHRPDLELSISI